MFDRIFDCFGGRHSLRREITVALVLKMILLGVLWFAVFRHDPAIPRPSAAELFASGPLSFSPQEIRHDIR